MAKKDGTKQCAREAWQIARLIRKYGLDASIPGNTAWTSGCQSAASAIATSCDTIVAAIAFREQP